MKCRAFACLALAMLLTIGKVNGIFAQPKSYRAVRVPDRAIHVDGRIDPIWSEIPAASDFVQQRPYEGNPPSQRTSFRVAYDNHNLYVLVRAYDEEPHKITSRLARRDNMEISTDYVAILIDSYFDRNTAFVFGLTPAGAKVDLHMSQNGAEEDFGWDAVWFSGTAIDDSGWVAEFGIPFSQLRYGPAREQRWGFNVVRHINRLQEDDHWNLIPQNAGGAVSYFGVLEGLVDLPRAHGLEILPYSRASSTIPYREAGNPFRSGPLYDGAMGLDLRYPLGTNLSLNVAVNPDFGEVEADPSEFNLTAYETYFPEKRPFFLEGANIFQYSIGLGDGDMSQESLFYTRRIGRPPQLSPDVPDGAYAKVPKSTPILFAAKISGRTAGGWSIGVLDAVTREATAEVREEETGKFYHVPVEPRTNYFVARLRREANEGRTLVGGMLTHVVRDMSESRFHELPSSAVAGGLDVTHRWHNDDWQLEFWLFGSRVAGYPEAIERLQTSSARYFQRPDAPHVEFDPERRSLAGFGAKAFLGKVGGGHFRGGTGVMLRNPGFEVNDVGFLREADMIVPFVYFGYVETEPRGWFRRYNIFTNGWHARTFGDEVLTWGGNVNYYVQFTNYWGTFGGIEVNTHQRSTGLLRGGPSVRVPDSWNAWAGLLSDSRKSVHGAIRLFASGDREGSFSRTLSGETVVQITSRFQFRLQPSYSWGVNRTQYVDVRKNEQGQDEYVLARLRRRTLAFVARLEYTLTPELSIQFYGMPYVTSGHYDEFKTVNDPNASSFEDRFRPTTYNDPPHFKFKEFRSNLVLRWEYRPGSTLYLVWSQGRSDLGEDGSLYPLSDMRDLMRAKGDHVFLVKASYWFSL